LYQSKEKIMRKIKELYKVPHRSMLIITGALILLSVMIASTKPQVTSALPDFLSSAVAKYPNIAASSLNNCTLCHTASIPSLNPYGSAYKDNGKNSAAFGLIEGLDSDGDGFTNLQEINALTFPGDPASFPAVPTATNTAVPTNTSIPEPTTTSVPDPTNTPIPTVGTDPTATPTTPSTSASATTGLSPASVTVGGSATGTVNLNNVPAGGFASAEFTCSYNPAIVEVSNITETLLFGTDPAVAVNGPQNGSFIFAIAGSRGNKALTSGAAFTFSAKGLQTGQATIDCQARVSSGNLALTAIPSTPASLVIGTTQGTFTGQVLAGKPVTVTLYDAANAVAGSVTANVDGTFSLLSSAGTYTAVASASGYLRAQGSVSITSGNTTTFQTLSLLAGDIDGNDVIDQFDALTIGINYNGTAPAAADLSNDGIINVLDLEMLALNYRQTGPQPWQ
jgi:hypothetical protein